MRPKGSPKTPGSGRVKGTPNKDTQLVLDMCREKANTTPAEVLAEALLDPEQKLWAAEKLMPYCYPKRRDEDASGAVGESTPASALTQVELLALVTAARGK